MVYICGLCFISAAVHPFFYHLYWSFSLHTCCTLVVSQYHSSLAASHIFAASSHCCLTLRSPLFSPNDGPASVSQDDQPWENCNPDELRALVFAAETPDLIMDTFDNFQFDSASSYGGVGVVDDTSSVYTTDADASSQSSRVPIESLGGLSLIDDDADDRVEYTGVIDHEPPLAHRGPIEHAFDEDFDGVLDELPDDSQVELPPHACRYVCGRPVYPMITTQLPR